jgi:hypothetical protein
MPVVAAIAGVASVGLQVYGMQQNKKAAEQQAAANAVIIDAQKKQNALKETSMDLDYRRRQLEALRAAQRARSAGLTAANSQGAIFGSGLQGGFGQIQGATQTNLLGLNQAYTLGQQNFRLDDQISQGRLMASQAQTTASNAAGITSLGGSILSSIGAFSRLTQGFGGSSSIAGSGLDMSQASAYNPGLAGSFY